MGWRGTIKSAADLYIFVVESRPNLRPGSTRGQNWMKSAANVEAFVGHRWMEIGATVAADEWFVFRSVSSVGPTKLLNLSNNAGRPTNASFVGRSWRQNIRWFQFVGQWIVSEYSTMERPKIFVGHRFDLFAPTYCFLLVSISRPFYSAHRRDLSARGTGPIGTAECERCHSDSRRIVSDSIKNGRPSICWPRWFNGKTNNIGQLTN